MNAARNLASVLLLLAVSLLAGCASLIVTDTTPLTPAQLNPPGSENISSGGMRFTALPIDPQTPDLLVLVAISGGGKRSAAWSYGVLKGMRQVMVPAQGGPVSLLSTADAISGVSGGSFTAAYYGLYRDAAFGRFEKDFLYRDTNAAIWGIYLLPWNWLWIVDPSVGTNDYMERVYDRAMFHGATFKDLAARGRPLIAIGATEVSDGTPFIFSQESFDLICSNLNVFPVARAVAASNGFPGLFSPITLTNRAADCHGREPGWVRRVDQQERLDPLSRLGAQANRAERYLDPQRMRYLHLADGGISDNMAMRVAGATMQAMAHSRTTLSANQLERIRRILILSVDGQGAQDPTVSQRRVVGGLFAMLGLVTGNQIDRFNFETMITVNQQLQAVTDAIRKARCARAPVIDGAPCGDVRSALLPISLAAMPPSARKTELLAIPTGLTLRRKDVDALIAAGQDEIVDSQPLQRFLADYPPHPAPLAAR